MEKLYFKNEGKRFRKKAKPKKNNNKKDKTVNLQQTFISGTSERCTSELRKMTLKGVLNARSNRSKEISKTLGK